MPRVKLTEDQLRELLEAYQTDEPVASIAERFGIDATGVSWRAQKAGVRRPTGLKPARTKWQLTEDQNRELLAAYSTTDEPVFEIAQRFGVPEHSVTSRAKEARAHRPQRGASHS